MKKLPILLFSVFLLACLAVDRRYADSIVREHLASVVEVRVRVTGSSLALDPAIEDLDILALEDRAARLIAMLLADSPISIRDGAANNLIIMLRHDASPRHSNVAVWVEVKLYQPALLQVKAAELVDRKPVRVISWLGSDISLVEAEKAEEAILELVKIQIERFVGEVTMAKNAQGRGNRER